MKIDPIQTKNPKNIDLAKGFNQLHQCFEDQKQRFEDIEPIVRGYDRVLKSIRKWILTGVGTIIIGGVGVVVNNQFLHRDTVEAVQTSAATTPRASQWQARWDAQNAINQEILAELKSLKTQRRR